MISENIKTGKYHFSSQKDIELKYWKLDATDLFISFLNTKPNGTILKYRPFRDSSTDIEQQKANGLLRKIYDNVTLSANPADDVNKLKMADLTQEQQGVGVILPYFEMGLTRFIVSKDFLISFIASPIDGKGNEPAGYYSEDIILIKRYKNTFLHKWNEIVDLIVKDKRKKYKNYLFS
jgi:hypothetical protein